MITEKELNSINLSATKRDFYQIWNELLETADKLSERWSPASTNESDPGIVLLKVLTAIADKLNYTIDKNTLECFMPSAAQEESMRKLCDMLGYNMKYYCSATVDVKIAYTGDTALTDTDSIKIPAFTPLQNSDEDVNYFTLETITLDKINSSRTVSCMEGTLQYCSEDTDNIITMAQIDDNYRYYLPENQIAENGIFITNIDDSTESDLWEKVDNLNVQEVGKLCFKFGYDSNLQRPYIQFPEDISAIIEDGLIIRYTRTNGINGNISYNTLSKIIFTESDATSTEATNSLKVSENFAVKNLSASINGADKETITDAYNAYKKTIGTFDTLITCRDYMNKIYQMTVSDTDTTPLVSNVIVSDIRDDINRAVTLCTFEDYGIAYKDQPLSNGIESKISNFDLVLYPFTNISGTPSETSYKKSFIYSLVNSNEIESDLTKNKTISHNIIYPDESDIACIVNYLRLKAKITTTTKVNSIEEALILDNIYKAIYKNFNSRKLDFGEEIPFDSILEVIQNADTRIKNVALEDPYIITKFRLAGATSESADIEFLAKSSELDKAKNGWEYYNKLALRNILAGRVALFDYNEEFKPLYSEAKAGDNIKPIYKRENNSYIGKITTSFKIESLSNTGLTLNENEVVQFRAPNFKTKTTWPAYVNYYLHLEKGSEDDSDAIPATFGTLYDYMNGSSIFSGKQSGEKWTNFLCKSDVTLVKKILEEDTFKDAQTKYGAIVYFDNDNKKIAKNYISTIKEYYVFEPTETTYGELYNFIKKQYANYLEGSSYATLKGIFRSLGSDQSREIGGMIDANKIKYTYAYKYILSQSFLTTHYIQITHSEETSDYTQDGLGKDAVYSGILANSDYQLGANEWLVINYTPSTTADDGTVSTGTAIAEVYEKDTIIRPSFNLIDSRNYKKQQHSPTKTSGYNIESLTSHPTKLSEIQNNGGMFTLGTNEQIELRDIAQVYLDGSSLNLYWIRQEDTTVKEGDTAYFYFDNDIPGKTDGTYHTLLEGEYLYYTDGSKLDYGWYGKGTRIEKNNDTPNLTKVKQNETDLQKQILSEGLLVALPWIQYNWSREDEATPSSKGLTATEYQYISLVKDDTLNTLSLTEGKELAVLASSWCTVDNATYTLSGSQTSTTLKQISLSENSNAWEAHTILNLNSAPAIVQTLHAKNKNNNNVSDTITLYYYKWNSTTGKEEVDSEATKSLTPVLTGDEADLSFETNYLCQSSAGVIDTHIYDSSSSATINQDKAPNDFSVKVFKNIPVSSEISLNNYGTGHWTKIIFKNLTDGKATLHINLLENTNGLIMLYYAPAKTSEPTKMAKIAYTDSNNKELDIYLCNKDDWWDNTAKYYLRSGLNIIQLNASGTLTISEEAKIGNLIFSDLDLVNTDDKKLKINPYLDYKSLDTNKTALEQAFTDILKIDPNYAFYYNTIIDQSTAIDLNTNIDSTNENAELLSSPATWYDYNNINNKFVISEIDADYLKTGITLTNSSRR